MPKARGSELYGSERYLVVCCVECVVSRTDDLLSFYRWRSINTLWKGSTCYFVSVQPHSLSGRFMYYKNKNIHDVRPFLQSHWSCSTQYIMRERELPAGARGGGVRSRIARVGARELLI